MARLLGQVNTPTLPPGKNSGARLLDTTQSIIPADDIKSLANIQTSLIKKINDETLLGKDTRSLRQEYIKNRDLLETKKREARLSENINKATFPVTKTDTGIVKGAKLIGNIPSSALNLASNIKEAVVNPVETGKGLINILKGSGAKLGEIILNTKYGQSVLQKAKDSGFDVRVQPDGKLGGSDMPELEQFNAVVDFVKDRYGNIENLKRTMVEDPVGALADLASVVTGVGGIASKAGTISKVGTLSKAGSTLTKVGSAIEPLNAIPQVAKFTGRVLSKVPGVKTATNIVSDVLPTSAKIKEGEVVKALDLTSGDVRNIDKLTGNNTTEFIINNKLLKGTPEEIATSLNDFRKATMKEVRNEIARVPIIYNIGDIPNLKKGLEVIVQGIDDIPGLEPEVAKIKALMSKDKLTLSDVQLAKELIDENSNIYSKIGDVKSSATARGLDNIRKDLRKFIEDEVSKHTEGKTDIHKLNNDVQTSYAIEDAISNRTSRSSTRKYITGIDIATAVTGFIAFGVPGIGIAVAKKISESPSFRLAFARALNLQPVKKLNKVKNDIANKTLSPESQKIIEEAYKKANESKQFIESGSAIVNQLGEDEQ